MASSVSRPVWKDMEARERIIFLGLSVAAITLVALAVIGTWVGYVAPGSFLLGVISTYLVNKQGDYSLDLCEKYNDQR